MSRKGIRDLKYGNPQKGFTATLNVDSSAWSSEYRVE